MPRTAMDTDRLLSFTQAAEVKACSRTTLYRAADDGRLNAVTVGGRMMIVADETWAEFEPNFVGARAERAKQDAADSADSSNA